MPLDLEIRDDVNFQPKRIKTEDIQVHLQPLAQPHLTNEQSFQDWKDAFNISNRSVQGLREIVPNVPTISNLDQYKRVLSQTLPIKRNEFGYYNEPVPKITSILGMAWRKMSPTSRAINRFNS